MKFFKHLNFNRHHHKENGYKNVWEASSQEYQIANAVPFIERFLTPQAKTEFKTIDSEELSAMVDRYRIFWLGHATALIQYNSLNILTDPVFANRVSPFKYIGPRRLVDLPLALFDLPKIDVVIVSHNHYDHLDKNAARVISSNFNSLFLVPLGLEKLLKSWGVNNVFEMDWRTYLEHKAFKFHCMPAKHFSGRSINDRNQTLWCSWFIESNVGDIYFAGDSAYSSHFSEIQEVIKPPETAILPIGAYQPRNMMNEVHVDPKEALVAFEDLKAKYFLPIHWGTYPLAMEPLDEPPRLLQEFAMQKGISNSIQQLIVGGCLRVK